MRGVVAIEYGVLIALISIIIIIAIALLATPPKNDSPKDPYQTPAAQMEWTMAVGEMESMMAAQEMYMEMNGHPAENTMELAQAGLMNPLKDPDAPSDYNYSTGSNGEGSFFVMAEPNPGNDPTGPNPLQPYLMYESGDTIRVNMESPPDQNSMTMETFLDTCFPVGSTPPPSDSCPRSGNETTEQPARAIGEMLTHMDEVFSNNVIANPYDTMSVDDRDKFLNMVITMTMNTMDRMDGKTNGVIDMTQAMNNITVDDLIKLENKILSNMGIEPPASDPTRMAWLTSQMKTFKQKMKQNNRHSKQSQTSLSKKKKKEMAAAIKKMLPLW